MAKTLDFGIKITASGSREVQGEMNRSAGFMEIVVEKARESNQAMKDSAGSAREFSQATGQSRGVIGAIAADTRRAAENTKSLSERARDAGRNFKESANHAKEMVGHLSAAHSIYKALKSGGPLKLLDALVPAAFKQKAALGMIGGGVAEGAVLGKTVAAAGQIEMVKAGLTTNLRGSGVSVEEMMSALRDFDRDSQLDFLESSKTANYMISQGFDAKTVTDKMRTIGDAVGATGGGQDEFQGIARALAQIQAKGKYSAEEGQQLAERGVNAGKYVSQATGISQADIQAGKADISADTAIAAILDGMKKQFAGGMATAAGTLEGKMSTLKGAIFQLEASIGQYLLPAVTAVVGVINSGVEAFNNLPGPIHQIIAYSMAANAGLLIFAGVLLLVAGPIGTAVGLFKILTFTLPIVNKSILQLAWSLATTLMPSLATIPITIATVAASIALIAVIAGATYLAIKGWQAATTQSAGELEAHFGALGTFWARAGDALSAIWNHPLLAWLHRGSSKQKGDEAEAESLRLTNASRRRRGLAPIASQNGHENDGEYDKPTPPAAAATSAIASGALVPATPGFTAPASAPLAVGIAEQQLRDGQSPDVQRAQAQVDALTSEIQGLQNAKLSATKEEKAVIASQLIEKQRALSAAKRELSAAKSLSGKADREAAKVERENEKRGDLYEKDARGIDKLNNDNAKNEQIADLQDELDAAREEGDATRVHALTVQIARITAQRELDESLIAARDEDDPVRKKGLEELARAKFSYESGRGALRAGAKAGNSVGSSGKKALSQNEIDAIFRGTGGRQSSILDGQRALNPGGVSNAFAGLPSFARSSFDSSGIGGGYQFASGVPSLSGFGSERERDNLKKERRIRVQGMKQRADGADVVSFKVDDLVIPYRGVGDL